MNARSAQSIRDQLHKQATHQGDDFQLLLTRYATERLLYRLSISGHQEYFCLKGAILFDLWFDTLHRPTRDADFLGSGLTDADQLAEIIRGICRIQVEDGMVYRPGSVRVVTIRDETNYGGLRVNLYGELARAHCPVQLDIGFGDIVTPAAESATLPCLIEGMPATELKVYTRATVVAEKLEAIVRLGMGNSRMKDYYDLYTLATENRIEDEELAQAIAATFRRRKTTLPADGMPVGLQRDFATNADKVRQWQVFLSKNQLEALEFAQVIDTLQTYLARPIQLASKL